MRPLAPDPIPVLPDGSPILLDGPLGTALEEAGIELPAPLWSAAAVIGQPDAVTAVHRSYARAGATVHTAASFRTTARALAGTPWEARWAELAERAVQLCRAGAGSGVRVAGSMAPLEDCFRPDLTPEEPALSREHGALAAELARAGADLLLVETMPTLTELAAATRAAVASGLPVWAAITLGPSGDFFDSAQMVEAAGLCADLGARALLVNCTPPEAIDRALDRLGRAAHRPPLLGGYANAIFPGTPPVSPEQYATHARRWRDAGACILGTCCGTGVEHLAALATLK